MKVTAIFHGVLSGWVGVEQAEFCLDAGALFGDLLKVIGHSYRANMPDQMWDDEKLIFRKPIQATSNGRTINEPDTPMEDGQEIKFFLMMAGG